MESTMLKIREQKGFTLVEIVVIIALLAIVALIVFQIFGNPFKQSSTDGNTTQIFEQFRAVEQGASQYYALNMKETPDIATLTTAGILKTLPAPTTSAREPTNTYTSGYTIVLSNQYPSGTTITGFGGPATDTVAYLEGVTQDICSQVNYRFARGVQGATPPAAIDYTKSLQCYGTAPNFVVLMPVYVN
ncbi:MAG: type II secretion system GspH family protein [Nitrospirae bacterium]|nr:type II secretion system GspH family protein [Nitrospirota bacterium]